MNNKEFLRQLRELIRKTKVDNKIIKIDSESGAPDSELYILDWEGYIAAMGDAYGCEGAWFNESEENKNLFINIEDLLEPDNMVPLKSKSHNYSIEDMIKYGFVQRLKLLPEESEEPGWNEQFEFKEDPEPPKAA